MVSRRKFVKVGSAAVVAGIAATGNAADTVGVANAIFSTRDDSLGAARFREHLGSTFLVQQKSGGEVSSVTLKDVTSLTFDGDRQAGVKRENFSMIFVKENGRALGQGIYRFKHEKLANYDLFLSPVSHESGYYEVGVSLLKR